MSPNSSILALDVGASRIGVAIASMVARLPSALTTLDNTGDIAATIKQLADQHQATAIVVGLPRGLNGQHTPQTAYAEDFGKTLKAVVGVPLYWQDEAVTSVKAETELKLRGKPFAKADIDALSAVYILEDFLRDHPEGVVG